MNGLTLFELDNQYIQIADEIAQAGGELTPEIETKFDEICDALIQKENAYLAVDKHLDSQIEAGKALMKKFQGRLKSLENQKTRLKDRLMFHMINTDQKLIECDLGKIRLQESTKVKDLPITEYPLKYRTQIVTEKLDKAGLKKDAKNDETLQSFLETTHFIKVY